MEISFFSTIKHAACFLRDNYKLAFLRKPQTSQVAQEAIKGKDPGQKVYGVSLSKREITVAQMLQDLQKIVDREEEKLKPEEEKLETEKAKLVLNDDSIVRNKIKEIKKRQLQIAKDAVDDSNDPEAYEKLIADNTSLSEEEKIRLWNTGRQEELERQKQLAISNKKSVPAICDHFGIAR